MSSDNMHFYPKNNFVTSYLDDTHLLKKGMQKPVEFIKGKAITFRGLPGMLLSLRWSCARLGCCLDGTVSLFTFH